MKTRTTYHSFQVNANTTLKINHLLKKKPNNNDSTLMKESFNWKVNLNRPKISTKSLSKWKSNSLNKSDSNKSKKRIFSGLLMKRTYRFKSFRKLWSLRNTTKATLISWTVTCHQINILHNPEITYHKESQCILILPSAIQELHMLVSQSNNLQSTLFRSWMPLKWDILIGFRLSSPRRDLKC